MIHSKSTTRLTYTGLCGGLEHLKIETRLMNERFVSVMGECVLEAIGSPSRLRFTRKTAALARMFPILDLSWEENTARWKWNSPLFDCAS